MTRRMTALVVALAAMLAVAAAYGVLELLAARAASLAAEGDLESCRRMAAQIDSCRRRPSMAVDREKELTEITGPIERAARAAGVAPERLVRIVPEPSRRVGKTPYLEKPIQVTLRNVPVKQIVLLIDALTTVSDGLNARNIRLSAPQVDDTGDAWNAELTLTYLIFEPI